MVNPPQDRNNSKLVLFQQLRKRLSQPYFYGSASAPSKMYSKPMVHPQVMMHSRALLCATITRLGSRRRRLIKVEVMAAWLTARRSRCSTKPRSPVPADGAIAAQCHGRAARPSPLAAAKHKIPARPVKFRAPEDAPPRAVHKRHQGAARQFQRDGASAACQYHWQCELRTLSEARPPRGNVQGVDTASDWRDGARPFGLPGLPGL